MLPPLNCAGCRKCCLGDEILLDREQGDDPSQFKTRRRPDGAVAVARAKDGSCVYLGKSGCTIQTRKPAMCRAYDCRRHALAVAEMAEAQQIERMAWPAVQEGFRRLIESGVRIEVV